MRLNRYGKLARFYYWSYQSEPSDNLCSFFWWTLWALILLPLTWPSVLRWKDCDDLPDRCFTGFMVYVGLFVALVVAVGAYQEPWKFLIFLIVAATLVVLIIGGGIIYIVVGASGSDIEAVEVTKAKYRSFKDKYCPKIEWTYIIDE